MNRRHFMELSLGGLSLSSCRDSSPPNLWKGIAMGIDVSVQYHGDADFSSALKAVSEAEKALTFWSAQSALSQLNYEGVMKNPPVPLLECLQKSRELFEASEGLFDPSVHSFLQWAQTEYGAGRKPDEKDVLGKLKYVDFNLVEFSKSKITMPPGVSLSLNAIAQGYITDLFTENFSSPSALINFGEYRVIGNALWPVEVKGEAHQLARSLAVSSGSGQRLSATSVANHLIDPQTGESPPPKKVVAVEADEAWLADGLSTIVAIGGGIPDRYSGAAIL